MTFGLTVFCSDWLVDGRGALLGELCSPFVFLAVSRLPASCTLIHDFRCEHLPGSELADAFVGKRLCRPDSFSHQLNSRLLRGGEWQEF